MDIGLARVSTRDQNPGLQIAALEQAGCGAIYEEKVSGVSTKRPVRDQVLAQLQPGDTLTVWKLDRLGRSVAELLSIITDLEGRGVRFRCLTQPIDTSSPTGRLFLTLLAGFAEFEREIMRERVLAGKERQRAEGRPMGPLPFGWADADTIDKDQAALLRDAATRALDGEALNRIVDGWNAQGLQPGKAARWRVTHLRRLLLNHRTAEIIGTDTSERLARLFTAPGRRGQGAGGGRPAEHLLSGILRCGRDGCGQPLYHAVKVGKPGGPPQDVYRCKGQSGGRFAGCGRTQITQAPTDKIAGELFITAMASERLADALNRRHAELLADVATTEELEEWRAEISDLEQVIPTRFGTPKLRRRHKELLRLVQDATARLMAQPELQALYDLPRSEDALRAAWEAWSVPERRAWLRRVFNFITVNPAPVRHRGSDVLARLSPSWKV